MGNVIIVQGQELEINYSFAVAAGYGHKKIKVELFFGRESKVFSATTNNMPAFDEASALEGDEKYLAFYKIIESQIENQVFEWISEF